jgi:glutaminase
MTRLDHVEAILAAFFVACSLRMSCADLDSFGGVPAARGDAPTLSSLSLAPEHVNQVVTLVAICDLYDGSGEYAFSVGLPSKIAVSDAIMGAVPGKLGIAEFCSTIDDKGASVVGGRIIEEISCAKDLSIFGVA